MDDQNLSVRHVRRHCLECCCDNRKYVLWCTNDGLHSTPCKLWPFRFGVQPSTFRAKYGDRLLTPETMPPANVNLDHLPGTLEEAAFGRISVEGYEQPAIERPKHKPKREYTPEQRREMTERLRRGREAKGEAAA